jgi:hypothetical protein
VSPRFFPEEKIRDDQFRELVRALPGLLPSA